jgi:4a-hydroxytetrahydrobiopterin dehydratase
MDHKILSEAQIAKELAGLPGWSYHAPNIEAEYKFANFRDAISFIVQVAIEAEASNHHPEFSNSWNLVKFSFCTHDVGNKVTDTDIKLAKYISETAARFLKLG